jgi:hypothetical protein
MKSEKMRIVQIEDRILGGIYEYLAHQTLSDNKVKQSYIVAELLEFELQHELLYQIVPTARMLSGENINLD